MLLHQIVDTIHTGGERLDETATTHHDGDFVQVDVLVFQFFQNEILAVVVLVGKNCEFLQFIDGVLDVGGENVLFAFEDSDFSGGGSRVDGKNLVSHYKYFRFNGDYSAVDSWVGMILTSL